MKINSKIFNLPPYISTSWNKVAALHMNGSVLVVTLAHGEIINIPGLQPELIETIFNAHATFLEQESIRDPIQPQTPTGPAKTLHPFAQALMNAEQGMDLPFRFGFSTFDGFGSALQHNPAQANAPDLPKEILQKITDIAKIVAPEDPAAIPKPEPHCNCMHCQIAKAITSGLHLTTEQPQQLHEEPHVTDEDLTFQQWDIRQTGDKMYSVANKLDLNEKYSVYLGEPVGCTCGKPGCEHILAVLKS